MNAVEAINRASAYSMIPATRLSMMLGLCRDLPAGCVVQCGVFRGGSGALLGWATGRPLWLLDRFTGLPRPGPLDGEKAAHKWAMQPGWCAAQILDVAAALDALEVQPDRVRIVGGDFAETLALVQPGPIALLHVDVDWYESTRACLARFLPDVAPGGVVIVDDYHHWPGCRAAVNERPVLLQQMDGTAVWWKVE